MQDFINSFKAHLYERTASPLLGSFVFYWIVCNYKLIVILFDGDMKINDKFDLIETIYPQNIWIPWEGFEIHYSTLLGNGFLLPLLISLIYILISPFPSKWIYKYWKEKQKEIQEIKQKIDDETPLTKEQSKKIRQDIINLELEYEKIFARKEDEITQLKTMLNDTNILDDDEVKKLKEEIETLKKTKKDNSPWNGPEKADKSLELTKNEINTLIFIGNNSDGITANDVSDSLKIHKVKAKDICTILFDKEFIQQHPSYSSQGFYTISEKGSKFLLENNLI